MNITIHAECEYLHHRVAAKLFDVLCLEHRRPEFQEWDEMYEETTWIAHARQVMFETVNDCRRQRGLGPVSMAEIILAEQPARGEVDYSAIFALSCANLVIGVVGVFHLRQT